MRWNEQDEKVRSSALGLASLLFTTHLSCTQTDRAFPCKVSQILIWIMNIC